MGINGLDAIVLKADTTTVKGGDYSGTISTEAERTHLREMGKKEVSERTLKIFGADSTTMAMPPSDRERYLAYTNDALYKNAKCYNLAIDGIIVRNRAVTPNRKYILKDLNSETSAGRARLVTEIKNHVANGNLSKAEATRYLMGVYGISESEMIEYKNLMTTEDMSINEKLEQARLILSDSVFDKFHTAAQEGVIFDEVAFDVHKKEAQFRSDNLDGKMFAKTIGMFAHPLSFLPGLGLSYFWGLQAFEAADFARRRLGVTKGLSPTIKGLVAGGKVFALATGLSLLLNLLEVKPIDEFLECKNTQLREQNVHKAWVLDAKAK